MTPSVPNDSWLVRKAAKAGAAAIGITKPRWTTKLGQTLWLATWNLLNRRVSFLGAENLDPRFVEAVVALQPKESGVCPGCLRRKPLDWVGRLLSHGSPPNRWSSPYEKKRGESYSQCSGSYSEPLAECTGAGSPGYHEPDWARAWTSPSQVACKYCSTKGHVSLSLLAVRWPA